MRMTVEEVWKTDFGGKLFNLYTMQVPTGKHYWFSARQRIVFAMIEAMLEAEAQEEQREPRKL
jgi:hypothetical protein